ncbi:MAG: site-specific integrase, partial [Candidatus Dormibacteria bacterium]
MPLTRLHDQIQAFLEHCEIDRNLSPLTVRMYEHYLDVFLRWAATERIESAEQLDPE